MAIRELSDRESEFRLANEREHDAAAEELRIEVRVLREVHPADDQMRRRRVRAQLGQVQTTGDT